MNVASDNELVVLVNSDDALVGVLGKIEAHQRGALYRALSVSISDRTGRLLLQKRAFGKYHSGGLWTNTCAVIHGRGKTVAAAVIGG